MNILFITGVVFIILIVILPGISSGKKTTNNSFSGNKTSNALLVAGSLVGTLVGGSSTIGTAQLAYSNGLSAWWFTLGGCIGVLLFGLVIIDQIYTNLDVKTIPDIISYKYGEMNGTLVALLSSVGTFLSFVAQIISGSALLMTIFPLSNKISVLIVLGLMLIYVFFGGALSLGKSGLVKTVILSISIIICGVSVILQGGGLKFFQDSAVFPSKQYFNLFSRGVLVDGGAGLSLVVGVLTTQSYLSALLSAKNVMEAKKGAIITSIIVPLIGLFSVAVGLYMKAFYPGISTKQALPIYINSSFSPFISGAMIASLLIAVVGTGSGLCMGMSTMIKRNLLKEYVNEGNEIILSRILLTVICTFGGALCLLNINQVILQWSFLSMGLRGAVAFFPLIFSLQSKIVIRTEFVTIAMIISVVFTLLGKIILPETIDPLFLGLIVSATVLVLGIKKEKEIL